MTMRSSAMRWFVLSSVLLFVIIYCFIFLMHLKRIVMRCLQVFFFFFFSDYVVVINCVVVGGLDT